MIKEINLNNINNEEFKEKLKSNPFGKYLIYYLNDEKIGYLYYSEIYDRIEINDFYIEDKYKRKGYGSLLLEKLIEKEKPITLEVNENNLPAISLYKKYGFKEVAKRKGYYSGIDAILMEKKW